MATLLTLLEDYGDQGAAQYAFKQILGEDFQKLLTLRFLSQTPHFVGSFTIKDRFGCLVSYQVVEHSPTDVVGFAADQDDLHLNRADTLIVRVNTDMLGQSLGDACGFDPQLVTQTAFTKLYSMGKATFPRRGPVFACFSNHPGTLLDAIAHIARDGHKEANLLILSRRIATAAVRQLALRNRCELLYIADHFEFHAERGFAVKDRLRLPLFQEGTAVDRWPLAFPENPTWKDIRMRFPYSSDQSVHIQFGSSGRMFEFREISQLVDKRSGKPNKQWALLRVLAKDSGAIPRITRGRKDAGKETVYRSIKDLEKTLQSFFYLSNSPFLGTDDQTFCRFDIGMQGTPQRSQRQNQAEDSAEYFDEITDHSRYGVSLEARYRD